MLNRTENRTPPVFPQYMPWWLYLAYSRGVREADWCIASGYAVPARFGSWFCKKVSYMSHKRTYPEK
ncbi:hypothetical protein AYI69_g10633 [Smittium culicis]|uniref:Uncharacterized protein n=1 Tax=Smittium culicis TaxID=133412 RepID=A0A1R1X4E4_9FUNG|nr:hypothetical protein AYI69_g10633 [Smittium culicis]